MSSVRTEKIEDLERGGFDLRMGGEEDGGGAAVKEVGQRREDGDRLTSGGNLTRPSELH